MTKKQPDRFERLVRKGFKRKLPTNQEWIYVTDAIELLRNEHKAVVRMVKEQAKPFSAIDAYVEGYVDACNIILDQLNERAK